MNTAGSRVPRDSFIPFPSRGPGAARSGKSRAALRSKKFCNHPGWTTGTWFRTPPIIFGAPSGCPAEGLHEPVQADPVSRLPLSLRPDPRRGTSSASASRVAVCQAKRAAVWRIKPILHAGGPDPLTTSARASTLKVIAPADLGNFSCTACGGCCRLWGILIDEPSFERARAFLENPPAPRPNPEMPWYFEEGGKKYYTLTGDGRCVFLGKDNHCYLHAHDPMLKSMVCRDYPRLGVMTPRGFEMSMSFSSYGAFLHTLCRPEPFTLIEGDMPIPPEAVNLPESPIRDPKPFGWDTYFLVESILIEFLNRTVPLDDALIAIARFLGAVEAMPDGEALRRKLRDRSLHPVCFMEHKSVSDLGAAYH